MGTVRREGRHVGEGAECARKTEAKEWRTSQQGQGSRGYANEGYNQEAARTGVRGGCVHGVGAGDIKECVSGGGGVVVRAGGGNEGEQKRI